MHAWSSLPARISAAQHLLDDLCCKNLLSCRYARVWGGIPIVWDTWLESTAKAGIYRRDEADFAVPALPR